MLKLIRTLTHACAATLLLAASAGARAQAPAAAAADGVEMPPHSCISKAPMALK